jgi:hypothetical protein
LAAFGLQTNKYTLTQLRYDLRKMKAHGLVERDGKRYAYHLTPKGNKVAPAFFLFHKRVCGSPMAYSIHHCQQKRNQATRIEAAYRRAESIHSTRSRASSRLIM